MTKRSYISKVIIEGNNKKTVNIPFNKGLNVVFGDTDCGKSHLYKIIYFVLGGSEAPDEEQNIPESEGYNTYYIELFNENEFITLKRARKKNSTCYIYYSNFENINEKTICDPISNNKLSNKLINILGISERKILAKLRQIGNLTITDIKKLFFVNEDEISQELKSPILSIQQDKAARGRSVFKCFVDGQGDFSSYNNIDSNEIIKARELSIKNYIEKQLANTDDEIKQAEEDILKLDFKESEIDHIKAQKNDLKLILSRFEKNMNDLTKKQHDIKNELDQNHMLYNRFQLLKTYYEKDLERIAFINEGNTHIHNLNDLDCPLCGAKTITEDIIDYDDVKQAVEYERNKIHCNMKDLENSISDTMDTIKNLEEDLKSINNEIEINIKNYNLNIEPEVIKNETLISKYIEYQVLQNDKERLVLQKNKYISDISNVKDIIQQDDSKNKELKLDDILSDEDTQNNILLLEKEIKSLLVEWDIKFASNNDKEISVEFDTKKCDIKVNGRDRSTFGQGIRAILYTAFLIGFMNYCIKNKLQHPGFVVIDSPLTTYKKKKNTNGKNEDLSEETHNLFYSSIKKLTNEQIIIFENDDKYPNNTENINIINLEHGLFPIN